ncbi:hypothetical protein CLV78_10970 [Aliiruegeria haliotis]|uniref:Glycosyl transferase family 2 n=1 Tax=Aliiruegeria haliotis TaxID=1280846 RepID=A0A2T0RK11_9RHOB|nr:hypothetical protein [Aliiruegeria haliotis]PRY21457.1 hypothetical protein CLV78_10970 [Aliiruegeria haliotis]
MGTWNESGWDERWRRVRDPYWWIARAERPFTWAHRRFGRAGFGEGVPRVVFLIKLVGQRDASDWNGVRERLQMTLASIDRQDGADISTFICGQDLPEGLECHHDLHFIPAPERLNRIQGIDKHPKHRIAARAIADRLDGPAYVVLIDADDIAHPGLCRFLIEDNNRHGYLIDDGFMWDVTGPQVVRLSQDVSGMPFHEMCGSCLAVAVDLSDTRNAKRILCTLPFSHKLQARYLARMGQPVDPVPFPAMIYAVNHDGNTSTRHGRDGARQRLFREFGLHRAEGEALLRDFGLAAPDGGCVEPLASE